MLVRVDNVPYERDNLGDGSLIYIPIDGKHPILVEDSLGDHTYRYSESELTPVGMPLFAGDVIGPDLDHTDDTELVLGEAIFAVDPEKVKALHAKATEYLRKLAG